MATILAGGCLLGVDAHASPGDLDETFAEAGILDVASNAIAVQPDGHTLLVDNPDTASNTSIHVSRVTAGGDPDPSFSGDGSASFEPGGEGTARATDVAVTVGGEILVAAAVQVSGGDSRLAIARLTDDGSLDQSFGSGGIATVDQEVGQPGALAIDAAGRIVAGLEKGLVRLTGDGMLDTEFSGDGIEEIDLEVIDLALTSGDSILALTSSGVRKFDATGEIDADFGDGGMAAFDVVTQELTIGSDPAGRVIVGSYGCYASLGPEGGYCTGAVHRLTAAGAPDPSYGKDGVVGSFGGIIAVDAEGGIVVAGTASPRRGVGTSLAILRQRPDGEPDRSLGFGGTAYAAAAGGAAALDLEIGPDGKITATTGTSIARFETGLGPSDADADAKPDTTDRCDFLYATSRTGCPRIARTAELRRIERLYLVPVLSSAQPGCTFRQVVKLWEVKRGPDLLVERGRMHSSGNAPLFFGLSRGRYYATVAAEFKGGIGFCERTRTPSITLSRNLDPAPE